MAPQIFSSLPYNFKDVKLGWFGFLNGQVETLDPNAVVAGVFRQRGGLHVADRQDKATTKCQLDKKEIQLQIFSR